MKLIGNIAQWIAVAFFGLLTIISGFHYSSLFLLLAAILMMPIKFIRDKIKGRFAIIIAVILMFIAIPLSPNFESQPHEDINSEVIAEDSSDITEESSEVIVESSETVEESSIVTEESSETIDKSSEVIEESSVVIEESSVVTEDSSETIDESSEVIEESSVVIEESSVVTEDSSETIDESSEVIEDSSIVIEESSVVTEDSSETVDESSEVIEESSEVIEESSQPEEIISGVGEDNPKFDLSAVPQYSGTSFTVINGNIPTFSVKELTTNSYEFYSDLDYLGRCGITIASIGKDIMPTEDRDSIGMVKPTGWHTVKYDNVDGKYLYNRCHLIGFQLTGENANVKNLITGTRYMNTQGMLPFENMVADYVKETNNHVAYRVTPIFSGNDMLARGVQMEAYSIEDKGEGICFNVFCYNVQPDIIIDYATGESHYDEPAEIPEESIEESVPEVSQPEESKPEVSQPEETQPEDNDSGSNGITYILNTNPSSHKFHYTWCSYVDQMNEENKQETDKSREEIIAMGYAPCKRCNP